MNDVEFVCHLVSVEYFFVTTLQGETAIRKSDQKIAARHQGLYSCKGEEFIRFPDDQVRAAHIKIAITYNTPFWPWRRAPEPVHFTLRRNEQGYEWIEGEVLR
jgi:hypothetical protein